jgi:hypothetical protein
VVHEFGHVITHTDLGFSGDPENGYPNMGSSEWLNILGISTVPPYPPTGTTTTTQPNPWIFRPELLRDWDDSDLVDEFLADCIAVSLDPAFQFGLYWALILNRPCPAGGVEVGDDLVHRRSRS